MEDAGSLAREMFGEELDGLAAEEAALESFFSEAKLHWDELMTNRRRGINLDFMARQTENLVTMRKNKIDIVKQRAALKKAALEATLKTKALEHKLGSDGAAGTLLSVYQAIVARGADPRDLLAAMALAPDSAEAIDVEVVSDPDAFVDKILGPTSPAPMPSGWKVVAATDGTARVIDERGAERTGEADVSGTVVSVWTEEDGSWRAVDQDGRDLEVFDFGPGEDQEGE